MVDRPMEIIERERVAEKQTGEKQGFPLEIHFSCCSGMATTQQQETLKIYPLKTLHRSSFFFSFLFFPLPLFSFFSISFPPHSSFPFPSFLDTHSTTIIARTIFSSPSLQQELLHKHQLHHHPSLTLPTLSFPPLILSTFFPSATDTSPLRQHLIPLSLATTHQTRGTH